MKKHYISLAVLIAMLSISMNSYAATVTSDPDDEETTEEINYSTTVAKSDMRSIKKKEVYKITKQKLADYVGRPVSEIKDEMIINEDIMDDSLEILEFMPELEEEFHMTFSVFAYENFEIMTVEELCKRTWKEIYYLWQFPFLSW
ncbi:MAG: hypothetical protein K5984_07415 [Bacteroidales bacterium]|nr:hypothetical protein [Bacteroidales bacterium]